MNRNRPTSHPLAAGALAVATCWLTACGGGDAEAPPSGGGNASTDTAAPVMTITDDVSATTATGPVTFTLSVNEDVGTTLDAGDITVTGGTVTSFTRINGSSATLVVTPTPNSAGTLVLRMAAGTIRDAAGNTNAETTTQQAYNTVAPVVQTKLVTFDEATAPVLTGFGGAEDATVVADPTDASNKVAKVVKSATAELWAGTTVSICPSQALVTLPFSSTLKTMTARVWSPDAGIPVRLKVENAADGSISVETEATTTVASGWQTLTFNFANQAAGTAALNTAATYNKASIFFNFGATGASVGSAKTYYLDDLAFAGSSFSVACPSAGGGGGGAATTTTITMDEATAPALIGFGGAEDSSVQPDPAGGTNKVARVIKSGTAEVWAGTTVATGANNSIARIGFSDTAKTITVRVWSPTAGTVVRLKVEDAADGTKSVETDATTTVANGWQTLTFNFANAAAGTAALNLATTYNKASIFFNFGTTGAAAGGARTYYFEDIVFPSASTGGSSGGGGTTTAGLPITFDDSAVTYTLTGFGGAEDASLQADPAGGSNKVARVVKSGTAELWAGTTVSTGANLSIATVPFTATARTMTMRVYAPAAGLPVRLKLEDAADNTHTVETEATTTVANGWQTLTFNFANQAAGTAALNLAYTFNKASVFFNFGTPGASGGGGTWYFDDLTFVP